MNDRKEYQQAIKKHPWILHRASAEQVKGKTASKGLHKGPLDQYIYFIPRFTVQGYLHFHHMANVEYSDYAENFIPRWEWELFQNDEGYHGYFNHLFLFNDLSYFDTIQANWEANGISLDKHNLHDLMLYVLLWRNLGLRSYEDLERVLSLYPLPPLWNLTHDPFCLPDAKIISKVMHQLTAEDLLGYFALLREECLRLNIMDQRIRDLGWQIHALE